MPTEQDEKRYQEMVKEMTKKARQGIRTREELQAAHNADPFHAYQTFSIIEKELFMLHSTHETDYETILKLHHHLDQTKELLKKQINHLTDSDPRFMEVNAFLTDLEGDQ